MQPNINHTVSLVSQFMYAPTTNHILIVKRILRSIKGSIRHGLLMKNNGHTQVLGYTNVDWAGNTFDHKSTTGYYIFAREILVSWKSKKQLIVAYFSAKVEYYVMASIASKLIWVKKLLEDLGILPL